jgi:antitoxin (DNA-binding transcriptional repressor) of toxin-antitoxin stability system
MPPTITIKELHATTGRLVRRMRKSRTHMVITDRGHPVAVLASPAMLRPRSRARIILPEYEKLRSRRTAGNLIDDLDAVRGDR